MFCTTGIRKSEIRMLNVGDVDLEHRLVTVRHAKRDRDREIPLSGDCVKVKDIFMEKYHKKGGKATDPLFKSQRAKRWSAHAIESCVDRIAARAGMEGIVRQWVWSVSLVQYFRTFKFDDDGDLSAREH
jgi:site-specific recombinase XerD